MQESVGHECKADCKDTKAEERTASESIQVDYLHEGRQGELSLQRLFIKEKGGELLDQGWQGVRLLAWVRYKQHTDPLSKSQDLYAAL